MPLAREREVLVDLMSGLRPTEIADRARVSKFTVRSQVKSILTKLGVGSQIEAVAEAPRNGWHGPPVAIPIGAGLTQLGDDGYGWLTDAPSWDRTPSVPRRIRGIP